MMNAMNFRLRKSFAALAAVTLVLSGCGSSGAEGQQNESAVTADQTKQDGGTLTVAMGTDPRTFDPAKLQTNSPGSEHSRLSAVYGSLLWRDMSGEIQPGLAEGITTEDGTVWTMTLKPDLTFTDGTPFDAEAVVFNWERLADPSTGSTILSTVEGMEVEAVDEVTVQVTLPETNHQFDHVVAASLSMIASPTAIQDAEEYGSEPVGAGPFTVSEWVPGDHLTVVANEDYYLEGQPYLDEVVFQTISDKSQQIETVKSGGADLLYGNTFEDAESAAPLHVQRVESGGGTIFYFNTDRPPFDDPRARKALHLAIDGDALAQIADPGEGSQAVNSLFSPDSSYFQEDLTLPKQDKEEAQRLFDELAAEGKPVDFTFVMVSGQAFQRTTQYLQAQLNNEFENVNMEVETIDPAAGSSRIYLNRDFDMHNRPGTLPIIAPQPVLSDLLAEGGRQNVSNYSSDEMNAALDEVKAASDEEAMSEAIAEVQRIYREDLPMWFYTPGQPWAAYDPNAVTDVTLFEEGTVKWDQVGLVE